MEIPNTCRNISILFRVVLAFINKLSAIYTCGPVSTSCLLNTLERRGIRVSQVRLKVRVLEGHNRVAEVGRVERVARGVRQLLPGDQGLRAALGGGEDQGVVDGPVADVADVRAGAGKRRGAAHVAPVLAHDHGHEGGRRRVLGQEHDGVLPVVPVPDPVRRLVFWHVPGQGAHERGSSAGKRGLFVDLPAVHDCKVIFVRRGSCVYLAGAGGTSGA